MAAGLGWWLRRVGEILKAQLTTFAEGREVAGRQRSRGLQALDLSWPRMEAAGPDSGGSWQQVADCGFHPPQGAPYPLPQLPLTPGRSQSCLLPPGYPFYDGEGWFSPNPADTSSLCLSLTLPPWEAPSWPPKMSQQDGAPAACSPSQMGPERGSGSPTVTRHVVS